MNLKFVFSKVNEFEFRFFKINKFEFCFFKSMNLNFVFSKSMNLDILIKHSTNLDFFSLEFTKQKQRLVSGLYQHILQTFLTIYQANRKFVM